MNFHSRLWLKAVRSLFFRSSVRRRRCAPRLETLEMRDLPAAPVVGTLSPLANSHTATAGTDIQAVFDQVLNSGTVTDQTLVVHARQTGRLLATGGTTFGAAGDTATVDPTGNFHAGELIEVTATSAIENGAGEGAIARVWQFRTATRASNGVFVDSGQALGNQFTTAAALGDLDGDGDLDLFEGNYYTTNRVWLNDGDGGFTDSGQSLGSYGTISVALGDVDGDGDLDLIEGTYYDGNQVWLNDGAGNFTNSGQALGSYDTSALAIGDVDGDGDLDFIEGTYYYGNQVWLNDGAGNFTNASQVIGDYYTTSLALGDVDGDGDLDLIEGYDSYANRVWLNDGAGNFTDSGQALGSDHTTSLALGDLDGDGDLDLIEGNLDETNRVWRNDGAGNFTDSGQTLGDDFTSAVAVGDLDGDGDLDFIEGQFDGPNRVWRNDGNGNFTDSGQALGNHYTFVIALGDLDGDGALDHIEGNLGEANRVWMNFIPNSAPTAGNDSFIIAEDTPLSDAVTDNDGDVDRDTLTYSLITGVSNGSLALLADGTFTYTPAANFNGSDSFTYQVSDGNGGTATATASITVNAVNDDPTDVGLSNAAIAENAGAGALVGTFSSSDPDAGDTFTYALVSGTGDADNALFQISGSQLRAVGPLDFEARPSYTVRVRTTDQGGQFFEKAFTVTVTNVNEAPTDVGLSGSTLAENAGAGALVGSLNSTDPDGGNSFTYSLVSGTGDTDNASFQVSGSQFQAVASLDFEGKASYSVRIRTTDQSGLSFEKAFTLTVSDVNEAPTDAGLSNATLAENAGAGALVGSFSTADPDAGNAFTYALVGGTGDTDNALFQIDGSRLRAIASLDFEVRSSYSVRVRTTDQGGLSFEKAFTLTVTDVNEAPTDASLSSLSVAENQPSGTAVGTLGTSDPDSGNTFTYTLVGGIGDTDNASFQIDGNSLRTATDFDFEAKSTYSVRVRTTDQGGQSLDKVFIITVTDVNEAPTDISLSSSFLAENAGADALVGSFGTTDPDAGDMFTYALVGGTGDNDNALFQVSGSQIRAIASLDFEAQSTYSVRVRSTDVGGLSVEKVFTITVIDVNETAPPAGTPPTVTINQATTQEDPTDSTTVNFTVVFSEAVTGFADGDVTLGGTAGATIAVVTGSGTTYNVAVSGMTAAGTVTVTVDAGAAFDAAGNGNTASTGTDNTVTFTPADTLPPFTLGPISGTDVDDEIFIRRGDGGVLEVILNGVIVNRVDPTAVPFLVIEARGGNDHVEVADDISLPVSILGEEGNDTLVGGTGNDTILGGGGDDLLLGRAGDDQLFGEEGNDAMDGQEGDDSLGGGSGNDLLFGSAGNDLVFGEAGDDALDGGAGNDSMDGGDGKDLVLGSAGNDLLFGSAGNDSMDGGAGDDVMDAGNGNDLVFGSSGNDLIFGGGGNDSIDGNDGEDSVDAGDGDDLVFGSAGNDWIWGLEGNDSLDGGPGVNSLDGGPGVNWLFN